MARNRYIAGDRIVLKAGASGHAQGEGRIISVQPESQSGGPTRYRVRFNEESFDRTLAEDDIDASLSISSKQQPKADEEHKPASGWINLNSMKIKK
ncbi:cold-shock protein [Rhizobium lemnae]|uniref:Cold-shock protein n=1 Tax=Rhizobium lemnae TaxID=1214924 RepID=A0ABV8E7H6_9HYPH|nr:cold-shock protein [Rhizobium lemnae]